MKKKYTYLIIILLIVASCAAFGRIAGNDFINFDDTLYVTENNYVQSGFNSESIKWAFKAVVSSNWHPLTMLSHMLDWSLFGVNASGHHLVSLLLHIGAVVFLFLFLNKTTQNIWPAAFAAAFFALHPLRVESVAWASERKDVLSMFFGMACLYAYAFYAQKAKLSQYLLCLILFALALMSKPMMVTLPFVLILLDYWPLKRWPGALDDPVKKRFNSAGALILEKVPFFCLTIASSIVTFWAQNKVGSVASVDIVPFLTRADNAAVSYVVYLEKIFWPVNLAVFYPYDFSLPLWKAVISGIIIILITLTVIYYIKKLPFLFVGWFIYLGTLVPVIGLVQVGNQALADRYTYLSSIGITVMLVWGISSLIQSEEIRKKVLLPVGLALLIIMSVLTWNQCGYWKNSITLFSHTLRVTNDNALAHNNLATALAKEGNIRDAIYHFNKAIDIIPDYAEAYYDRGTLYCGLGQYQSAIDNFSKAISLRPDYIAAYNNRAFAYINKGDKINGCQDAKMVCELGNCRIWESPAVQRLCR